MNFWKTKTFKTRETMEAWINKHASRIQYVEIFINNGFGVEYRKLRRVY